MNLEPLKRAWSPLPLPYKATAIAALIVLILGINAATNSLVSRWHNARFDRAQAAAAKDRADLEVERDAAIRRAEALEAKASLLQTQIDAQKELLDRNRLTIAERDRAVEAIEHEIETGRDALARDTADPQQSADDVRARLRNLGLLH